MTDPRPPNKYPAEYPAERAWNYVLWLLGRQAYTKAQLRDKLRRKGASEETVGGVLTKLETYHFVDDAAYAKNYVRARRGKKGELALKQELYAKGVAEAEIDPALKTLGDDTQQTAALALLHKNAWRWKGETRQRKAKAYAYLARRGYRSELVSDVLVSSGLFDEES